MRMASLFLLLLLTLPAEGHNGQHLFPFGYSVGDYTVQRVDDGSSDPLLLNQPFIFFGRRYNQVIVNTNGIISFSENFTSYSPSKFPSYPCHHRYYVNGSSYFVCRKFPALIAPFWRDFDLRQGGNIYYRQTADSYVIQSFHTLLLNNSVSLNNIAITNIMIATWDRVPPYGTRTSHPFNTLQVILAGDGTSASYVTFIYGDIQWGEGAQIGFNAGDGTVYFTIPGALSSATLNITQRSNVGSPGLFIYKVDGIDCSDTEVMWLDEEYTLYQHSCTESDDFLTESTDICGYIKLRVEKKVFELSAILDTYNVSIYVTVTERLGIISFKDVNFILSVLETETTSEVEVTDVLGTSLPKLISISKNETRVELNLRVTRMSPSPKTLLLKVESTSKQTCFENGTVIKIILFGATQASFQLKLLHVDDCLAWTAVHSTEEIISVVVEEIKKFCSCDFTPDHIINATFICNYRENTHVILRAQISYIGTIHANELVKIVSLWARNRPHLTINETVVTIDPTCPVEVDILAPNDCYHQTKLHIIEISSSVAVGLIIIGGLIVTCSKCLCQCKRNRQRKVPKCASLSTDNSIKGNEYHVNKQKNNSKEDYATITSDIRGTDIIHITSNAAYGKSLQSKTITLAYEVVNLQDCCVTTYGDCHSHHAVYDIPL